MTEKRQNEKKEKEKETDGKGGEFMSARSVEAPATCQELC